MKPQDKYETYADYLQGKLTLLEAEVKELESNYKELNRILRVREVDIYERLNWLTAELKKALEKIDNGQ